MYWPTPGLKRHPDKRWAKPDRIFFGFGACHILAGVYLKSPHRPGFYAEEIVPGTDFPGSHIYVTDGEIAFDYHGYVRRSNLLVHYGSGWRARYPGWSGTVRRVAFDLLDTQALNARKFYGPDQFIGDVLTRAEHFLTRMDHACGYAAACASPTVCASRTPMALSP